MALNEKMPSSFYPPRARWYAKIFYLGHATRHRLALDRLQLPRDITLSGIIGGLLVPGLAVYLRGPRLFGQLALMASVLLLFGFIVGMGYPLGNYAFGLMISVHVSGFAYYCSPFLREKEFKVRIAFTLLLLVGMGLCLYLPFRNLIQGHWFLPLLRNGHVIIVQRTVSPATIQRGDWLMYSYPSQSVGDAHEEGRIWLRAGYGWAPVLAMAGDRVSFSTNSYAVNGVESPLLPYMPHGGEVVVPEKNWFIWPELAISGHGNTRDDVISGVMLKLATVKEDQFVGKPLKHWFWRKQLLQ